MRTPSYHRRNYSYDSGIGRQTYGKKNEFKGKVLKSVKKKNIVFVVDGTGSMANWPEIILENIGSLESELEQYLPEYNMSITVIGDAHDDRAPRQPLQVCNFGRGKVLHDFLSSFGDYDRSIGGGGNGSHETYELAALLYSEKRYCKLPKNNQSYFFFVGDEMCYDRAERNHIKALIGDHVPSNLRTIAIFNKLKERFNDNVWIFRKHYGDKRSDNEVHRQWESLLGADKVSKITHPDLIREAAIEPLKGTIAKETGNADKYLRGLRDRSDAATTQYMADFLGVKLETLDNSVNPFEWVQGGYSE